MTGNLARYRARLVIAAALGAFAAGCGPVQKFNPVPEDHLTVIEKNGDVPPAVTQLPTPPAPVPRKPQETYSVVVTDVPVKDVLFALARDAGVNVDVSGDLQGNVTINAIDQTLPQILDRLSRQASLRYSLNDGTLVVLPDAPYWQNYPVDYVNLDRTSEGEVTVATQIATVGGSVDEGGESGGGGGGEDSSNGSSTKVKSSSINAFWGLLGANLRQLITGKAQSAESATEGDDPVVLNPIAGIVSVRGTSLQHQQVGTYIDQVTASAKRQVLIEVTVVEVKLSDQYQAGVDWARVSSDGGLGSNGVSSISDLIGGNLAVPPVFTMTYNNAGRGFSATVKLLEQFGDTKVLSTPRIMALNNQTALLKVVDELVYFTLTSETIESTGPGVPLQRIVTSEVNTVPVGFVMSVTPQINQNGNVSLNVRPTLTRVLDFVVDPAPRLAGSDFDNLVPQLSVKEIESLLEVADGQTVVIGGLMQDSSNKQRDGIPILSQLPLVGDLFSYRDDNVTKSELVVFLRPTVIRSAGVGQEALASLAMPLPAASSGATTP